MTPHVAAWLHCHTPTSCLRFSTPWRSASLMHSFINFQGQVLHLVQGDTYLFNYVDNLIAFYNQGQGVRLWEVSHGSGDPICD